MPVSRNSINRILTLCLMSVLSLAALTTAQVPDTAYLSIDMQLYPIAPTKSGSAVDDLQGLVVLCAVPLSGEFFIRTLSVSPEDGSQWGEIVDADFPTSPCYPPNPEVPPEPIRVLFSEFFMPGEVILLQQDLGMQFYPLAFLPDGTPVRASYSCVAPMADVSVVGAARALTEMPGGMYKDGITRLFIGTNMGRILVINHGAAGISLEAVLNLDAEMPINALHPIPQFNQILLGVAAADMLYAINSEPALQFKLFAPAGTQLVDFTTFGDPYATLPEVDDEVLVAFTTQPPTPVLPSNGPSTTMLSAMVVGEGDLVGTPPQPVLVALPSAPMQLVSGSLLMTLADSSGVIYDARYSPEKGLSSCYIDVVDDEPDGCLYCCVGLSGNVDGDPKNFVDVEDLTLLIDFLFISFTDPECMAEANVDGGGIVDVADLTKMIDFLFISFQPTDPCR